jgi:hypothetical protein
MLSEGSKIASTLKDYIDFLKANDGRIMIGPWDAKMLEKVKQNIQSHKLAWKIIWPLGKYEVGPELVGYHGDGINIKCYHEFHINWEYPVIYDIDIGQHETEKSKYIIKCKSLLDGLTLDFENKKAIIYDLKTTQKLWHFEDSIDQYDYLRQLYYYTMAVKWYLKNECEEDPDKWDFFYYIVGIDTTGSYEIRVFEVEPYMVNSRALPIHNAITDIGWHQMNNKWDHSREYYEGDGSENLNL